MYARVCVCACASFVRAFTAVTDTSDRSGVAAVKRAARKVLMGLDGWSVRLAVW